MLLAMKPVEICKNIIGAQKLTSILEELSSPQIKAILKEGNIKVKLPGGYVSQNKRRILWLEKITTSIEIENQEAAAELLQQWLLNHRRQILMDYLDRLKVKHRHGETDESFLVVKSKEKVQEAALWLLGKHDPVETAAYLYYVAFQQRAKAFDGWDGIQETLHARLSRREGAVETKDDNTRARPDSSETNPDSSKANPEDAGKETVITENS